MAGTESGATIRVLHVVRPAAGGMVTHLRTLIPGLIGAGVHSSIVTAPGFSVVDPPFDSIPTAEAPIKSRPNPIADLQSAAVAARMAATCDLIHGHGIRGAWIAALASRLAHKPFLFTAHNLAPASLNPVARILLRLVIRRSSRVICVSRAVAESMKPFGLTGLHTAIIPNGIDLRRFDGGLQARDQGLPPRTGVIAAIGRLSHEKGFAVLVEAATVVLEAEPATAILIGGDGPERESLESLIRKRGVQESVRLLGRVEDAAALLASADIVVIPSLAEGQGIVALEAMAARRPVVASAVGGLAETVEDGITGLLVPPGDSEALGRGIVALLHDSEARALMGEAGRARVESDYTCEQMVSRTIKVYEGILTPPAHFYD